METYEVTKLLPCKRGRKLMLGDQLDTIMLRPYALLGHQLVVSW